MTSSNDRLDQIEALLQRSIVASDERMTRIEEAMERDASNACLPVRARQESNARMTRIENLIESNHRESNERMTRIEEAQEVTDAQVGVLVGAIDELARRVDRVVNYLENQSGNGRGGTGGQPQP